jgi:PAS domain-containing protein
MNRDEVAESPAGSIVLTNGFNVVSVRQKDDDQQEWSRMRIRYLDALTARGVSIEMLQYTGAHMRYVVSENAAKTARESARACSLVWHLLPSCTKIRVATTGLGAKAGIFSRILSGFAARKIPVFHFSDSDVTISLIVPQAQGARAQAYLRTTFSSVGSPFEFDAGIGQLDVNGKRHRLGMRQAKLLGFLLDNAGRIIEPQEAARHLFGSDHREDVGALRVHLHNLRKKIEADPDNPRHIVTVAERGYIFRR